MSRAWEKYDDPDTPLSERHDPDDIKEPYCGCGDEASEQELARNKCNNCGKPFSK